MHLNVIKVNAYTLTPLDARRIWTGPPIVAANRKQHADFARSRPRQRYLRTSSASRISGTPAPLRNLFLRRAMAKCVADGVRLARDLTGQPLNTQVGEAHAEVPSSTVRNEPPSFSAQEFRADSDFSQGCSALAPQTHASSKYGLTE